jgi:hypothetical protein
MISFKDSFLSRRKKSRSDGVSIRYTGKVTRFRVCEAVEVVSELFLPSIFEVLSMLLS